MPQPTEFEIKVPSKDPKKKTPEDSDEKDKAEGSSKPNDEKAKDDPEGEELSEEDLQLKNELEMLVERLKEGDKKLYHLALETLRVLIRTSTSSMTSVPKPLKFLRPHYPELQALYETWDASADKSLFAEILSVLAMTYSDTEPRGTLKYRLWSKSTEDPGTWGHEYVRHLAAELGDEYDAREHAGDEDTNQAIPVGTIEDLRELAKSCAIFLLAHNAEPDAVDLLEALEFVDEIAELVDENTFSRVCQYMIACVPLLPVPDDISFLRTTHNIYIKHSKFPEALAVAIRLGDPETIRSDFNAPANPLMQRQLAFILARAGIPLEWLTGSVGGDDDMAVEDEPEELPEDLLSCLSNSRLSESLRDFAKELGVLEPKSLEDVYKSHLENTRATATTIDSARGNLAGTFVNAFVNAGFANDTLISEAGEGNSWIYKNKDHGMMSAAASVGLCFLWDCETGMNKADSYTHVAEELIKAGGLFATGMMNASVLNEADAAIALLGDYVMNPSIALRTSAMIGLALAYCGRHHQGVLDLLLPVVADEGLSMEIVGLAALTIGFVFVGSGNGEATGSLSQALMERAEMENGGLDEKWAKFFALGLGLLYLGQQEASDATIEFLKAIDHPLSKTVQILVEGCAFAGTGNVLKVQAMLHHCDEHIVKKDEADDKKDAKDKKSEEDTEKESDKPSDDTFQTFAVIAIALIAMGENIGAEMSLRQFNHLMTYGEPVIRKAVPLAIALVSTSNPQLPILDTLSKYSHDNDLDVARNAIFAMGLVGAGTNNARLAQMLRQLAGYYYKEADALFVVRIAQGLVHMGKGTIGLNPFFLDNQILSRTALAGLLGTITAFTDAKGFVLDKYHWMLFFLAPSMQPRFLITLNEDLEPLPVTVRVGQAVDVVGQAGKPRTISGFQTHQTPVRLGVTERAELATEEYIPFAHVLEGFVILKKNPGWEKEDKMDL
ncbi:armadillo-type protein [Flagelloscypha sp. PMI_526]|nr:armadillo-type protein [Flagelloscypha sp. PMI_526]